MATLLPGFFAHVDLGRDPLVLPTGLIDVSGLDFAIVLCEDDAPVSERFTTWSMQADAATLYQARGVKNTIIIGDAGAIYRLDEDLHNDDGVPIPIVYETMALPEDTPEETETTQKRLHYITWQVKTPPPSAGYKVIIKVQDVDNASNFITRTITQTLAKERVQIGIRARQWTIHWQFESTQDVDMLSFGQAYQQVAVPYTKQETK